MRTFISNLAAESVTNILIHVGVNDIDHKSGQQVFTEIKENIALLRSKYPEIKVTLAELTPRKDNKDTEVMECNRLINEWAANEASVFIASHANLRENKEQFLEDNKHIAKKRIGVFVVNLKKALCQASGTVYRGRAEFARASRDGNRDSEPLVTEV